MSFHYADEKLTQAVYILATGKGRIKERLADAAMVLTVIRPEHHMPDMQLRRRLEAIIDDLRFAEPRAGEGRIAASMRATDEEDASAIASRIVSLCNAVSRKVK